MNNFYRFTRFYAVSAVIVLMGCAASALSAQAEDSDNANMKIARNLDVFNSLYKELNTFYVDTIDAEKSIETAINAMLDNIDPYTEYIPPKSQDDFLAISTGEYGGIGSIIMEYKGNVYISEPYEGSPAARAGLRPGDKIVMIDNDSVAGWGNKKVSEHLKGQAKTKLRVVVERPYHDGGPLEFNITREKIKMNSVEYFGTLRKNIGYIALNTFNQNSPEEVRNALIELKKNPEVKCIVLDLRGNGGGLLESAVQIVGLFVPKGTQVLQTRGRFKQNEKTYKTTQEPVDTDIPLVVMIDGGSASSSEIVAGSLQDLDRAVILGSRSYGKGLVQTTRPLPFEGLLKVTISKYYIPSGRLIQAIDYSRRNPDGSVARIPDSLTTVFHTAHGREVRDGGGITPDIKVEYPPMNRLTYNIIRDEWAFNFATKFTAEHATIAPPEDFEVTDSIYADFKRFINPDEFKYDKVCEDRLKQLREAAETEGYMNDSTKAQFEVMEKLLKHDLSHDLDIHRTEIAKLIADEIQKRYYFQRGQAIESLKTDNHIAEVEKLLNTPGEYERILNIAVKDNGNARKNTKKNKPKKSQR